MHRAPRDISNVMGRGPPDDLFDDSDMCDFAKICKQVVVYGGYDLIFSPIGN